MTCLTIIYARDLYVNCNKQKSKKFVLNHKKFMFSMYKYVFHPKLYIIPIMQKMFEFQSRCAKIY